MSGPSTPFTALVMAGSRPGDPLALATGVAQKPLVPVAGVPMLMRVLGTLRAARWVDRLVICGLDPALAQLDPALPYIGRLRELFGATYAEYCRRVPRLIPSLFAGIKGVPRYSLREALHEERRTLQSFGIAWLLLLLKLTLLIKN